MFFTSLFNLKKSTFLHTVIKSIFKYLKMVTSPVAISVAPINMLMAWISIEGPARREVPESTIAWHPPLQNIFPLFPTTTSSIEICQYPFLNK